MVPSSKKSVFHYGLLLMVLVFLCRASSTLAWDFTNKSIDVKDIISGGPPKDGIPALFDPEFSPAQEADFIKAEDRVLGISLESFAKAYPIRILSWHELANDTIGDIQVLVSW